MPSAEMGNTEVRKDMVRRAFSSANLRLLPSADPTPVKRDFLRRVDTLSISSHNSSNLSLSADIPALEATTTATSANDSTHHIQGAVGQKRSKQIIHTRGQESIDIANGSFFQTADAKGPSHHGALSRISLTGNAEDISDFFNIAFRTVNESQASTNDDKLICQADNHHKAQSTYSFSVQSFKGVEMVRRQRTFFAARLESELEMQKEAMEAAFEKCYDASDRLHEIDLLNLREDHEAEIKYLQNERDVALSQVQSLTAKRERSRKRRSDLRRQQCLPKRSPQGKDRRDREFLVSGRGLLAGKHRTSMPSQQCWQSRLDSVSRADSREGTITYSATPCWDRKRCPVHPKC